MMARRFRVLALPAAVCCALFAALAPAGANASTRRVETAVSPDAGDFALARVSFPAAHGRALTSRSLRLLAPSWSADDLIALATPARPHGGARVALLLVANRVTNVAEPVSVKVPALALAALGPARVKAVENPIERRQAPPAWLCGLAPGGRAPALRALGARGRPIPGLHTAGAVAQAFPIACGLPAGTQLKAALAPPQPQPAPPAPERPECAPCDPRPGSACPLVARPAYCVARREKTGAH